MPAAGPAARLPVAAPCPDLPCTDDPELFFAESPEDVQAAKAVCRECPVQAACLAEAVQRREPWGVWGGELFLRGAIVPHKRPRGRPRKTEQPATIVAGLAIGALGVRATSVAPFIASLTDSADPAAGLRFALVNTLHELGGATGVAVLSSAAGAGLIAAHRVSHDFTWAFTTGAAIVAATVATAAALVPASRRRPAQPQISPSEKSHRR